MDEFTVQCPYCGEAVIVAIEQDVSGELVQDCEVCCRPWLLRLLRRRGRRPRLRVERAG